MVVKMYSMQEIALRKFEVPLALVDTNRLQDTRSGLEGQEKTDGVGILKKSPPKEGLLPVPSYDQRGAADPHAAQFLFFSSLSPHRLRDSSSS